MSADRLLVPVANPETADRLLDTAVDLAADRDLELLVLSVVTVPMQLSLSQARTSLETDDREQLVDDAVDRVRGYGVDASGRIRFARSVASGICGVATDADAEAVLLGWRGQPRRRDVVLGSHIDAVLEEAPSDVLVERIDRDRESVSSVLVPVAGGPNTRLAASIAGSLARTHDARAELLTVVPDRTETVVGDARDLLTRTSPELGAVSSVETVLEGRSSRRSSSEASATTSPSSGPPRAVSSGASSSATSPRRSDARPTGRSSWQNGTNPSRVRSGDGLVIALARCSGRRTLETIQAGYRPPLRNRRSNRGRTGLGRDRTEDRTVTTVRRAVPSPTAATASLPPGAVVRGGSGTDPRA